MFSKSWFSINKYNRSILLSALRITVMTKKEKITEEAFDVESVIGHKRENGKDIYKVKWVGYADPTWEPVSLLDNCSNLIKEFWKNEQKKENQDSDITKLKDPPDFRIKYSLPFSTEEDPKIIRKDRIKRDLIPWQDDNDEDEPVETSFFNLQTPPYLTFIERNRSPKWESCGHEAFNDNPKLDETLMPKLKIYNIVNKEEGCFVQVKDDGGKVYEMEYELFSSFFPNSLFEYFNSILPKKIMDS